MSTRRAPWLSALIVALLGAVWLIVQVVGGVVSLVGDIVDAAGTTVMTSDAPPVA
ncbi:hypothetical protein FHT40_006121 [Mycolicibacterium sp. BK556]|uniref:hypothetical protein n=1 Tax=unclassified Mycolicibacterium TaxID=2636767 RepID=UPI0016140896|nr:MULTISPECIES: hypothetical protein [unclassified Mycolicibacterium]MBB3606430.1 hypothetical protein [Mycolicibacterium sp. BK556]MBB3636324.1 hypothetical protein [Mycolicibacterium sp. BK607]